MSWRTTAALFVVLLLVAAVALWQSRSGSNEAETPTPLPPTPVTENPFRNATVEDVTRLDIKRESLTASFAHEEDGSWHMTVPTATQVMSVTLTNQVRILINTGSRRTIAPEENPLQAYGLDEPDSEITLVVRREEQQVRYQLLVGNETPTGDGYYTLKQGDPRVYIMSKSLLDGIFGLAESPPLPQPAATPEAAEPYP